MSFLARWAAALAAVSCVAMMMPAAAASDPHLELQYGLGQIGAPDAWTLTKGGGVVIAVVDTGVDATHEDLSDNLLPAYNASRRSTSGTADEDGHGTHVTGTAAAVLGNGRGGSGVAPLAKVLPIKVFDGGPVDATGEIAVAVRYALAQGARVINLSISSLYPDIPVSDLEVPCNDAFVNGALCVIAAGNRGETRASGFSRDLNALVVTAHDRRGSHAGFASRADTKWALSAPGVAIHSTVPGSRYGSKDGTSMATPHVAGAAALLFSRGLSNQEVAERLVRTARSTINPAVEGAGHLDVAAALGVPRQSASTTAQTPSAPEAAPTPTPAPAPAPARTSSPMPPSAPAPTVTGIPAGSETPASTTPAPSPPDPPTSTAQTSATARTERPAGLLQGLAIVLAIAVALLTRRAASPS